jgi:hypothetical protein
MTLLLRNEEDILRENIEYHLNQGVDLIIATNNLSIDGTEEILREYEAKGLVYYLEENEDIHHQGKWVTSMARLAAKQFKADWIINNDADEFWWPSNHSSLKKAFIEISQKYNIIEAQRRNFVFIGDTPINQKFYETMIFKEAKSINSLGNPLPPKQAHIASEDITVSDGNHLVTGLKENNINLKDIEIFHFPIRSKKQFTNKIYYGGRALQSNQELHENIGSTWRHLYNELSNNGDLKKHLNSQELNTKELDKHLRTGSIMEDKRLKLYLNKIFQHNI